MEREILLSGIGGQGVQLAAKMLAHAGMVEGRHVLQFSMFMGTMRGGSSECTVVVADAPVEAPPVVPYAWAAIAMHPSELGMIERKLRQVEEGADAGDIEPESSRVPDEVQAIDVGRVHQRAPEPLRRRRTAGPTAAGSRSTPAASRSR